MPREAKDAMAPSEPNTAVPATSFIAGEREDVRYRSDGEGAPDGSGDVEKGAASEGQDTSPQEGADGGDNVNSEAGGKGSAEDLDKRVESRKAENEQAREKLDASDAAGDAGIARLEALQQNIVEAETAYENAVSVEKAKKAALLEALHSGEKDTSEYLAEVEVVNDEIAKIGQQHMKELAKHQAAYDREEERQREVVERDRRDFMAETDFMAVYEQPEFQAFLENPKTKSLGLGPAGSYYAFKAKELSAANSDLTKKVADLESQIARSVENASKGDGAPHRKVASASGLDSRPASAGSTGKRTPQAVEDSMLHAFTSVGA